MSIITFWKDTKKETGQSLSVSALATYITINYNYRILIIDTKYGDSTIVDAFWQPGKRKTIFSTEGKVELGTGMASLSKAITSNKVKAETMTNYAKVIFKDRLELLNNENIIYEDYLEQRSMHESIIKMANQFYDLVFVDLEGTIDDLIVENILKDSDIIVPTMTQKLMEIKSFINARAKYKVMRQDKEIALVGRYDKYSKYTIKNMARATKIKDLYAIPYNTWMFEAANEGQLDDYFIKYRNAKSPSNPNSDIIKSVESIAYRIIEKLKEMENNL